MVNPISAANAYANIARLTFGIGSGGTPAATPTGDFASVLKDAMSSIEAMGHKSDAQSHALATGKANMVDVVTAVSETEVAIDAVVAVRDRVIAAYQDIMKMPILLLERATGAIHLSHRERSTRASAAGEGLQNMSGLNPLTTTLSPPGRGSAPRQGESEKDDRP
jgi:flagellar hook-basal body complex protein FliE